MSTVLSEKPVAGERSGQARRVLLAAGVGLVAGTVFLVATRLLLTSPSCRNASGFGCLGIAVMWSYLVLLLNFGLTWAALRALRIRPASLTALLGTGLYWYLAQTLTVARLSPGGPEYLQIALETMAFALAAWATQPRARLWPRIAAALACVLLMPINALAATQASQNGQDSALTSAQVTLLGPKVPAGYHLEGVGSEVWTEGNTFYYRVSPDFPGKGATTMAQLQQQIQVTVGPVQPGFAPPAHCAALTSVFPVPSPACTLVAPGVWRHADYQYVEYFTRVGNSVVVLQATTPPVSETLLLELADSMRVRTPSYFTGG